MKTRPKIKCDRKTMIKAIEGSRGYVVRVMDKYNELKKTHLAFETIDRMLKEDTLEDIPEKERTKDSKTLSELLQIERQTRVQRLISRSEDGLTLALNNNEQWAIRYCLSTLGRQYGYEQTPVIKVKNDEPLNINLNPVSESEFEADSNVEVSPENE